MVSMRPFSVTELPKAGKRKRAEGADRCCQRVTILFKVNSGSGTRQNKKQRGNSNDRKVQTPKHPINAPSHQVTSASMPHVSCPSDCAVNLPPTPSNIAATNKATLMPLLG